LVDFFAEEWSRVADCTRVFGEEAELPARQITSLADYLIELDRLVKFCGTTADRWEARLGTNGSAPVDSPSSGAEQQLPTAVPVSPAVPGREQSILPPDPPLLSWSAIIAAINELQGETVLKDSAEGQQTVRKTHSHLAGPIKFGRKGSQPRVGKRALIQWWTEAVESVTSATEDNEQRRESKAAVSESIHDHGRGEVAADVSGSVKKRRK